MFSPQLKSAVVDGLQLCVEFHHGWLKVFCRYPWFGATLWSPTSTKPPHKWHFQIQRCPFTLRPRNTWGLGHTWGGPDGGVMWRSAESGCWWLLHSRCWGSQTSPVPSLKLQKKTLSRTDRRHRKTNHDRKLTLRKNIIKKTWTLIIVKLIN